MDISKEKAPTPQADFLGIIENVLGKQFDENGRQLWWCEESDQKVGFTVTDGKQTFF